MMNKESVDIIIAVTQILTLIAIVTYVIRIWHIASATRDSAESSKMTLREFQEVREQELAPHVITYFDIPFGERVVYLVITNIGRSVATDVKIEFTPKLMGANGEDLSTLPVVKDGIGSIPPEHEIRTFYGTSTDIFSERSDRPLTYRARVTYFGGVKKEKRSSEQTLDLSAYKGVSWASRQGMHELVTEVQKIAKYAEYAGKELSELSDTVSAGINLRNPTLAFTSLEIPAASWQAIMAAKLVECKTIWSSIYGGDHNKLFGSFLDNLRLRLSQISEQIVVIRSNCPPSIDHETKQLLVSVSTMLADMGTMPFYADGGRSFASFDAKGREMIDALDRALTNLGINRPRTGF